MTPSKEKILNDVSSLLDEISKNGGLIWGGIVGSFNSSIGMPRDIDLLLLFNKLDKDQYLHLIKKFKELAVRLSNEVKFVLEERNGPFKPGRKDKIQFHLIVQDRNFFDYTAKVAPLSYIEWTINHQRLFGLDILKLFDGLGLITKEMLLDSKYGGVNSSLELIRSNKIYYAIYENKEDELLLVVKEKKASKKEKRDLLVSVVKANVRNFVKYVTKNMSPDQKFIFQVCKRRLKEDYKDILGVFERERVDVKIASKIILVIKKNI